MVDLWVLLVSGWFSVSKTIIPEAQEHFLNSSARRDTHLFGGLGLIGRTTGGLNSLLRRVHIEVVRIKVDVEAACSTVHARMIPGEPARAQGIMDIRAEGLGSISNFVHSPDHAELARATFFTAIRKLVQRS